MESNRADGGPGERTPAASVATGASETLAPTQTGGFGVARAVDAGAAASAESPVGHSVAQYRILAPLGKGGMGEVYLAFDPLLERKVALKLLPADFTGDRNRVRRFTQEAKAASALNHPNIVSIYGVGESEFGQYIVMELVEGRNLRSLQPVPLPPPILCEIGVQVARALEVTHAAGLIHRDIKPDNIMIRRDGLAKVLDFGLARLVGPMADVADAAGATLPGTVVGTVTYMSPEQARGEWLTSASDIFSLGIVFYELATGKHPFHADSAIGYLHSIVSRQPIPPAKLNPEIAPWLESVLLAMLEKDPARRCSASDVTAALQHREAMPPVHSSQVVARVRRTVGRRGERGELHATLQAVSEGHGTMLCVSGEPGQGKTTLIEDFLMDLGGQGNTLVARGRCSERLAGSEAYLPVLEALDSLLNGAEREMAASAMKTLAPGWYAQMAPSAQPLPVAPSPEKLKRELAALLQEMSRQQPLVLFFDDIHWADVSTVDVLSYVGARLDSMRVLVLVSFRAPELCSSNQHFLKLQLELQTRGLCREIALGFFAPAEIQEYLELRFPGHAFPADFAGMLHRRTEGNPLFVADLLGYLQQHGAIQSRDGRWHLTGSIAEVLTGVPESVRSMVQRKIGQLDEAHRKLLAAASVQGSDFDASVVAKALDADPAAIEEDLERIERSSGFVKLVAEHEYPDRSLTLRYRFVHVLYQNAFFSSLQPTRRASLSRVVAEALLQFHGPQAPKIAAQLAFLFETARVFDRAAAHYQAAAQNALVLFASSEAEALARRGVEAARAMPEGEAQAHQELALCKIRAAALRNLHSHSGHVAAAVQRRLLELAAQLEDYHTLFAVHFALGWARHTHQDFAGALEEAVRCGEIAERVKDPCMIAGAGLLYGDIMTQTGRLAEGRAQLERVSAGYDRSLAPLYARFIGTDPGVHARSVLAIVLAYMGYPDRGGALLAEAVELAKQIENPIARGMALICEILSFKHRRDEPALAAAADQLAGHCMKNEFQASMMYFAKFGRGWSLVLRGRAEEGIAAIDEAIADALAIGSIYSVPILASGKVEALRRAGRREEAVRFADEQLASAEARGQWLEIPDLYRAKGECLSGAEAEACFLRSMENARRIEAKLLELAAAVRLAELYRNQGRQVEAARLLSPVYGWFTEGFEAPALKRARALLDEVAR